MTSREALNELFNEANRLHFGEEPKYTTYNLYRMKKQIDKDLDKLGELEDIEEELGVSLITLFKALKQGYIYALFGNFIFKIQIEGINYNTGYLLLYNEDTQCTFENYEINAYGKTWALTREELE